MLAACCRLSRHYSQLQQSLEQFFSLLKVEVASRRPTTARMMQLMTLCPLQGASWTNTNKACIVQTASTWVFGWLLQLLYVYMLHRAWSDVTVHVYCCCMNNVLKVLSSGEHNDLPWVALLLLYKLQISVFLGFVLDCSTSIQAAMSAWLPVGRMGWSSH